MRVTLMRLKFDATCSQCGVRILAPQKAYYARPLVWCASHGASRPEGAEPAPAPVPAPDNEVSGLRVPRASRVRVMPASGVCFVDYASPGAYIADAMQGYHPANECHGKYKNLANPKTRASDQYFLGGERPYERFETLQGTRPWLDALPDVERMRREIEVDAHRGTRRRVAWQEEGGEFSRERDREGHEACNRGTRKTRVEGSRIVRISVNIGARAGRNQSEYVLNGASLSAAIDALEDKGVRCEVWGLIYMEDLFESGARTLALRVMIKGANETLNLAHLLAWTAHLGCWRVAYFSWCCTQPRLVGGGFGRPDEAPGHITRYWQGIDGEDAFMWPFCVTPEQANMAIAALEAHVKKP